MSNKKAKLGPNEHEWYSPTGEDIRVTLPDGSVALVPAEEENARPLPAKFNRAAHFAGCLMVGGATKEALAGPSVPKSDDQFSRNELIQAQIRMAMKADPSDAAFENAFTGQGIPQVKWLTARLGFAVDASERDEALRIINAAQEKEDEENGGASDGDVE